MDLRSRHFVVGMLAWVWSATSATPVDAANAVVGDGTPTSCDEAALDAALTTANSGGGTITFACGAEPVVISITSAKSLTANVTVDGDHRVALSGGHSTRHFEIAGLVDCTLREIRLIDGAADDGGSIRIAGSSLRLEQVTIEDGAATGDGGAIHVASGALVIRASRFTGNVSAGSGGAIRQVGGGLDIAISIFIRNQAALDGGAVAIASHTQFANLLNSFGRNVAGGDGGAIDAGGGSGFIDQSQIVWNTAGGNGGGVHVTGPASMTFSQNTFERNVAGEGGALFLEAGTVAILDRTTLSDNEAEAAAGRGGAIANLGTLTLENATLSGNLANGSGGGLHNEASATLRFTTIAFNQADVGGGIASSEATLHLRNVILSQDSATTSDDECAITGGADIASSLWEGTSCGAVAAGGNQPATDALLTPLGFTCPPSTTEATKVHDLASSSPARDTGVPVAGGTTFADQRGVIRPQGSSPDVGAVEWIATACPWLFKDGFERGTTFAWSHELP